MPQLDLNITENHEGADRGFLGVAEPKVEILFIAPGSRGYGPGRTRVQFAIDHLAIDKVYVNEQNEQAVGFYVKMGFTIAK